MISHPHQCIFVHIPKCGGSSIESIIWPKKRDRVESNLWMGFISKYHNKYQTGGLQHLLASQIKQEVGDEVFGEYFKFSIVRNPWDKAVSQFEFMKKRKDLREYIGMSKDDCLKTYLALIQKKEHVQWEKQYKFLMDENDNLLVDFVGRLESFEEDVNQILDKLNISISRSFFGTKKSIPHKNKSVRSHYRDYYDSESREIVGQLYQDDIEKFEYSF